MYLISRAARKKWSDRIFALVRVVVKEFRGYNSGRGGESTDTESGRGGQLPGVPGYTALTNLVIKFSFYVLFGDRIGAESGRGIYNGSWGLDILSFLDTVKIEAVGY